MSQQTRGLLQLCHVVCSDILTPLPALGVPFEIDDVKGPLIANPIRTIDQVRSKPTTITYWVLRIAN